MQEKIKVAAFSSYSDMPLYCPRGRQTSNRAFASDESKDYPRLNDTDGQNENYRCLVARWNPACVSHFLPTFVV